MKYKHKLVLYTVTLVFCLFFWLFFDPYGALNSPTDLKKLSYIQILLWVTVTVSETVIPIRTQNFLLLQIHRLCFILIYKHCFSYCTSRSFSSSSVRSYLHWYDFVVNSLHPLLWGNLWICYEPKPMQVFPRDLEVNFCSVETV